MSFRLDEGAPCVDPTQSTWLLRLAPSTASDVLAWLSVAAGLAYVEGWIAMSVFYSSFAISPEQVGIDFAWVAVRFGLLGALVAILALGVVSIARTRAASLTLVDGTN